MISTESDAEIIGLNESGYESGNDNFTTNISLPWLQDDATNVWNLWDVTYRDVYIVSSESILIDIYNLTDNDLQNPAQFEDLKALILTAE